MRSGSYARAAVALALALSSGACMSALGTALGLAGADRSPPPGSSVSAPSAPSRAPVRSASPTPSSAPAPTSASARPQPKASSSRYTVMPTERWRLAMGRPALTLQGLVNPDACAPTPMGVAEVLSIPDHADGYSLAAFGPFELSLYARDLREAEAPGTSSTLTGLMVPGQTCGPALFVAGRLNILGPSQPVSVLR